jgi:hypothetical protein
VSKVVFEIKFNSKKPPRGLSAKQTADYIVNRKFYDWTADYNYLTYTLNDEKVTRNKDTLGYYTREGSLGLFNADGFIDLAKKEQLKKKLAKTDSIIWHGFISFDAETSKGFTTQEQAIKFLNQSFNSFIERTHLKKDNVELFASLHQDTPHHHHIHFSFFEKEPQHIDKNGKRGFSSKGSFNQNVLDNYLISANMYLSENSEEYYTSRQKAVDGLKQIRAAAAVEFTDREVQAKLLDFAGRLPKTGRIQYFAENMEPFRAEIDTLSNMIMRMNPEAYELHRQALQALSKREAEVKGIAKANNIPDERAAAFISRLRADYMARLGNQTIGLAKDMLRRFRQEHRAKNNEREKKIAARRGRKYAERVYTNFIKLLATKQRGIQADFQKDFEEIQREIEREHQRAAV